MPLTISLNPKTAEASMQHTLRVNHEQYVAYAAGKKRHDIRVDTRGFEVGDLVILSECEDEMRTETGRTLEFVVGHVSRGPGAGLPFGLAVISLLTTAEARAAGVKPVSAPVRRGTIGHVWLPPEESGTPEHAA